MDPRLTAALLAATWEGIPGAALVDRDERVIATRGAISEDEAAPLAKLAMYRAKEYVKERLFAGEIVTAELDDRHVAVGVANRQLFVVAIVPSAAPDVLDRVRGLRDRVESILRSAGSTGWHPAGGSDSGSGSGPAELSLVDYGITIRRERGKA